jgi:hypothetical protein
MKINSDVNILGGLPDFELVDIFFRMFILKEENTEDNSSFSRIRTDKSIRRFEKAIKSTLLHFNNSDFQSLLGEILKNEGISNESLLMFFWNASGNNDLLHYINTNVFFPAYYSGRLILKQDEISACLRELKTKEKELKKWSDSTIEITASKYLTLLKKFNLLEGRISKSIKYPYLTDRSFVFFIYWLLTVESKSNVLESQWLQYSFYEREFFIERVMDKKFSKFLAITFTGDKLQVHPLMKYKDIYYAFTQS